MLLRTLQLRRLLSFGPESPEIVLGPLNLIIGPNGSGKSNLIDAISLLQAAPSDMVSVIREGGGTAAWLWKGDDEAPAELCVRVEPESSQWSLRHRLEFLEDNHRFTITHEKIEKLGPGDEAVTLYESSDGQAERVHEKKPHYRIPNPQKSGLARHKDPEQYPGLSALGVAYEGIRVYRAWTFGRQAPPRRPQPADLPTDHLLEDASNLALMLNSYRIHGDIWEVLLESLGQLFDGIVDIHVQIQGGTVQLFLNEGKRRVIPASRLSDGTLRWLSLLAVMLNPEPPLLVCIEEPELGLHPDMIPGLARLLRSASERMQLVVTTHSVDLVDAFSNTPDVVQVCERPAGSTTIQRLDGADLKEWLEHYSLGELWTKGQLGGNRW